ncbi:serine hydrolase domain-containing protein [Streptomyces sp. NBC_01431]|uniref:serine hydrolase domain-containing protein n=1 Tax=Streptomyces sp. NBC_01431 TaxID=2903863 RepID=UPI002E314F6F|nr:serine hydrolase domain-containing protein [Streptomyces sp. NBC_01431]
MNARTRTTLMATTLVLGMSAGPALAAAPAPTASRTAARHITDTLDTAAVRAAIAGVGKPGADATAALVRIGGTEGAWLGSAGVHDLAGGTPADPDGRFRAGSVTKVFTAAMVLQLAGEGRVDLNRPARTYLPDLIPAAYAKVTVRQLLNHTSGIPSVGSPDDSLDHLYAHRFDGRDPADVVREATARKPDFAPGTAQHYDNIGYTVAGLLIERVTGDSYAHQLATRITRPLHLKDTYVPGADPTIRGPHNHGYQVFAEPDGSTTLRDVTVWGAGDTFAAGDLISTTADLERFTRALFTGHVVRAAQLREMFTLPGPSVRDVKTGKPAAYSVGLSTMRLGGHEVWGKTGGRWGYNTVIAATLSPAGTLTRTLVYSVNSTDAKGSDMNPTAMHVMTATFGTPDPS